jgi:hypothetical protein
LEDLGIAGRMDLEKEIGKLRIASISFSTETSCKHDNTFLDYIKD